MSTKSTPETDYLNREFLIEREFAAPRDLVFKAWTDPKHLAQWWGPRGFTNPVCDWNAAAGNDIYVVMRGPNGMDFPMGGRFVEVTPPEKLVMSTGALDESGKMLFELLHTITFTERNGKTLLSVRAKVIRVTPDANRYIGGYEAGMGQSLDKLSEALASKSESVVVERTYTAPVEKVWEALTDVNDIKGWYFPLAEFKAEPGFKFQFAVEHNGANYVHLCEVKEAIPNKRISYSWRYEGQPGDSLVTIDLFAAEDKTRVKLLHEGLETFPKVESYARKNFEAGWNQIIGTGLKDFVEKN